MFDNFTARVCEGRADTEVYIFNESFSAMTLNIHTLYTYSQVRRLDSFKCCCIILYFNEYYRSFERNNMFFYDASSRAIFEVTRVSFVQLLYATPARLSIDIRAYDIILFLFGNTNLILIFYLQMRTVQIAVVNPEAIRARYAEV